MQGSRKLKGFEGDEQRKVEKKKKKKEEPFLGKVA